MVNYSPFNLMFFDGKGNVSPEPIFPMHCQRRSRWFFSKYQVSVAHTEAEALLVKVMNVKG